MAYPNSMLLTCRKDSNCQTKETKLKWNQQTTPIMICNKESIIVIIKEQQHSTNETCLWNNQVKRKTPRMLLVVDSKLSRCCNHRMQQLKTKQMSFKIEIILTPDKPNQLNIILIFARFHQSIEVRKLKFKTTISMLSWAIRKEQE